MSNAPEMKPGTAPWPDTVKTRDDLDRALEAGEDSGLSSYTIREIMERLKARLKRG